MSRLSEASRWWMGFILPCNKQQKTFHFSFKICCQRYTMLPSNSYVTYYNALMLCILRRGVVFPFLPFSFFLLPHWRSPTKRDEDQISNERTSQLLLPAACSCQGNKNKKGKEWHSKEVTEMPSFTWDLVSLVCHIGDHPDRVTTNTISQIPINWIQAPYSTPPYPCPK